MANPPITIPPFSNVPAPGSPIKSDWAQQITQYVVDQAAALARTAWANVTFQNLWTNFGGGYQTCQYRKNGDNVELRGVAGGGAAGTAVFTLPAGFRPPASIEVAISCNSAFGRLQISTLGVCISTGPPNVWLSGVEFSITI